MVWLERASEGARPDVYGARLEDGRRFPIATGPDAEGDYGLDVFGDYVVWVDADYQEPVTQALRGMRLSDGATFDIAPTGENRFPSISDDWVVWQATEPAQGGANWTLLARNVRTLADPVTVATGFYAYGGSCTTPLAPYHTWAVPETQHYVAFGFRDYWGRNGGLPVFGYPLTEAGPGLANSPAAQLFERQRSEWHPENAGTPYDIELGLLGTDDARARSLLASMPFQRLPDDTPPDATRAFFRETGHRLCAGFRAYWEAHGLDLEDPGMSLRESLALFGYPISEEFTDPATDLTIQYVERAVFEYHPENAGTPYTVLLRRLGAKAPTARGE